MTIEQRGLPEGFAVAAETQHASFGCECGGTVTTRIYARAAYVGAGITKYVGVPCDGCGATYTVEIHSEDQTG